MPIPYTRKFDEQLLDAMIEAADLALDEIEYGLALDAINELAAPFDVLPPSFSQLLVNEVEKVVGLGLDEFQFTAAESAVRARLALIEPPSVAPDAHLEMAYEDRFVAADSVAADYFEA